MIYDKPGNYLILVTDMEEVGKDYRLISSWTATGISEAEQGFRRIKGYRSMPTLVDGLRRYDEKLDQESNLDSEPLVA